MNFNSQLIDSVRSLDEFLDAYELQSFYLQDQQVGATFWNLTNRYPEYKARILRKFLDVQPSVNQTELLNSVEYNVSAFGQEADFIPALETEAELIPVAPELAIPAIVATGAVAGAIWFLNRQKQTKRPVVQNKPAKQRNPMVPGAVPWVHDPWQLGPRPHSQRRRQR